MGVLDDINDERTVQREIGAKLGSENVMGRGWRDLMYWHNRMCSR